MPSTKEKKRKFISMRISKLTLSNFRTFDNKEQTIFFDGQKQISVILGNNGCGKTSIMDALATSLSNFIAAFPGKSLKNFTKSDIHVDSNNHLADFLKVSAYVNFDEKILRSNERDIEVTRSLRGRGAGKLPEQKIKEIKEVAEVLTQGIKEQKTVTLPILAYYGTGRGFFNMPQRRRNFKKTTERWDCYDGCFQPTANFKKFVANFELLEAEELRKSKDLRDYDYELPNLKFIRKAINDFVGEKYKDPRIELHPFRFVMDEMTGTEKREIRLEQMSDGYKIMTTMVADIASRMVEANPDSEDPLQTPGIILIDEVDLHLHPKWQRDVLNQLAKTFRNVHFVVTTHSPIVLLGADANKVQVIRINDGVIEQDIVPNLRDLSINQLLLDSSFGLDSVRSHYWQSKISRQDSLLEKQTLTDSEQKELNDLNNEVKQLSFSESANAQKVNSLLTKLAKSMGIDIEKIV